MDQQQQQHQQQHHGGPLNQNQNFEMQYASNNSFLDPMQPYGHSEIGQQKSYIGNEFEDEPPLLEGTIIKINSQNISWTKFYTQQNSA